MPVNPTVATLGQRHDILAPILAMSMTHTRTKARTHARAHARTRVCECVVHPCMVSMNKKGNNVEIIAGLWSIGGQYKSRIETGNCNIVVNKEYRRVYYKY